MAINIIHMRTRMRLPDIIFSGGVYKLLMKWPYQKVNFNLIKSLNLPEIQGTKVHVKWQHWKVASKRIL